MFFLFFFQRDLFWTKRVKLGGAVCFFCPVLGLVFVCVSSPVPKDL